MKSLVLSTALALLCSACAYMPAPPRPALYQAPMYYVPPPRPVVYQPPMYYVPPPAPVYYAPPMVYGPPMYGPMMGTPRVGLGVNFNFGPHPHHCWDGRC